MRKFLSPQLPKQPFCFLQVCLECKLTLIFLLFFLPSILKNFWSELIFFRLKSNLVVNRCFVVRGEGVCSLAIWSSFCTFYCFVAHFLSSLYEIALWFSADSSSLESKFSCPEGKTASWSAFTVRSLKASWSSKSELAFFGNFFRLHGIFWFLNTSKRLRYFPLHCCYLTR